jgi:hypothetical protein
MSKKNGKVRAHREAVVCALLKGKRRLVCGIVDNGPPTWRSEPKLGELLLLERHVRTLQRHITERLNRGLAQQEAKAKPKAK